MRPELHHSRTSQFILDELEFGTRVAYALYDEANGFGPLFDPHYEGYLREATDNDD